MTPFAGDRVGADKRAVIDDDATADAAAENDTEDDGRALGRPIPASDRVKQLASLAMRTGRPSSHGTLTARIGTASAEIMPGMLMLMRSAA